MAAEESDAKGDGRRETYHFVRRAGKMETIFTLYGELGIQSNVVMAATYASSEAGAPALDRDTLYPALRQLIDENWALRLVMIEKEVKSGKAKGYHEYWEAQLQRIDLDQIVEFTEIDDTNGLDRYIESQHNTWIDTRQITSTPIWRLKVLNGRYVVFVYHHAVCDGMSGYAFHRRLLHHLNVQKDSADRDTGTKTTAVFEPAPADPPSIWLKDFPAKFSLIKLLWDVLFMHIVRLLYKGSIMFDDLPIDRSATALEQRKSKDTQYCKTAIRSLRIPSPLLSELLSECRRHDTTLGSLLHVVSVSTMATDIYPNSKITLAASPISGRPWAVPAQGPDLLVNSVGSNMRIRRLEQYRATTRPPAGHASGIYVNADRTWALSTAYTKHFRQGLSSLSMFNGSLAGVIYSDEIENVYKNYFPNLWLYQRYFTLVSNLGAFATDTKIGSWNISDVQFSAAAVKSNWGFVAPVFNVSSVRGGDCVITCSMEEGLISMQVIERILAAMEKRLSLLLTPEREPSAVLNGKTESS